MINAVRGWLTAVIAASFLVALAQGMVPEGTVRKISGLIGGLVLMMVLVRPLLGADFDKIDLQYDAYAAEIGQRQAELETESQTAREALIAEKTEAYILDKAASLGLDCTVRVLLEPGEDGIPVPAAAELAGQTSAELADYMAQELGIPKERQVYHEAE